MTSGASNDSEDYYSILNVPRTASEEDIKQSFRRLSILYHPDKHIDPVKKAASEQIFQKINTAYSVLASENTRRLYDELGEEGIRAMWQVGPYTGQYSEKQRILETIKLRGEQKLMRFEAYSSIATGFDASTWIDDYSAVGPLGPSDYIPALSSMNLAQTFQTWITPETSSSLSFNLATENGTGEGTVQLAVAHQHNASVRSDLVLSAGQHRSLSLGVHRVFDVRTVLNGRVTGILEDGMIYPVIQAGITREILGVATGATLAVGAQNSVTINAAWMENEGQSDSNVTLKLSPEGNFVKYGTNVRIRPELSAGLRMVVAPNQSSFSVGLNKAWSPLYSSGAFLECQHEAGISLKLSITRLSDFKFVLPIRLSHELSASTILIGSAVPAVIGFVLDYFVISPIQKYMNEKQLAEESAERERIFEAKSLEAALIADILEPAYKKRVDQEKASNGLILTKAIYKSPSTDFDVLIPLQVLIVDSQLLIAGGKTKAGLLGFYDIDPGHPKTLLIEYTFKGIPHRAELADHDPVMLPARHHKL